MQGLAARLTVIALALLDAACILHVGFLDKEKNGLESIILTHSYGG